MSDYSPDGNDGSTPPIQKFWKPVGGFIAAVIIIYEFYKIWQGDRTALTIITAGLAILALIITLIWVGVSKKPKLQDIGTAIDPGNKDFEPRFSLGIRITSWVLLGLILAGLLQFAWMVRIARQEQEKKLVVVVATFEGPEEVFGVRNEIIESLNAAFSQDREIEVIAANQVIAPGSESAVSQALGEQFFADVVIWGWYRPTENPNITIHVRNLQPAELLPLSASQTVQPETTLDDLKTFTFQQKIGSETSALIYFLSGFVHYRIGDYSTALERFDSAISNIKDTNKPLLANLEEIYFYRGNSNLYLENYQQAIRDYEKLNEINSTNPIAHNNLGIANYYSEDLEMAILEYKKAIELFPRYADAFYNLGDAYFGMGKYEQAVESYDQAIQIEPNFYEAYNNRGFANFSLKQYEQAVLDCNKAISIDPRRAEAYSSRGGVYYETGQYEKALQDLNKAIKLDPAYPEDYLTRGRTYQKLGRIAAAEEDFKKYKELTGQSVP